jgi:hypothetical protein
MQGMAYVWIFVFSMLIYASKSRSLSTVLVTLTRSVVVSVVRLLPPNSATNKRINKAAPTIHTQGCAYQLVVVSEVVTFTLLDEDSVLEPPPVLSCAHKATWYRLKINNVMIIFQEAFNCNCFMFICLRVNKWIHPSYCYFNN